MKCSTAGNHENAAFGRLVSPVMLRLQHLMKRQGVTYQWQSRGANAIAEFSEAKPLSRLRGFIDAGIEYALYYAR
jgi:hypothetical protein